MYAIIYWVNDDELYPVLNVSTLHNNKKTLKLFERLDLADRWANQLELTSTKKEKVETRVISIEGVKE